MSLTTVDQGLLGTYAQYTGFKNRIINGACMIDQRNAGVAISAASLGTAGFIVDRFQFLSSQSAKFSAQQNQGSVTPPSGFTNYIGVTSASAYSVGSGDYFLIQQGIEGYNVSDLAWGTANAKTITLSFWAYSSLTGTFGGSLWNSNATRSYPFSYTISSANTWTYITVTIAGDTSGATGSGNSAGFYLRIGLGAGSTYGSGTAGAWTSSNVVCPSGSVSVVGTNGATFYITGVQLEKGSTATSFDYRPYGTELALCQRYYRQWFEPQGASVVGVGLAQSGTTGSAMTAYNVLGMRTTPACSLGGANFQLTNGVGNRMTMTSTVIDTVSSNGAISIAGVTSSSVLTAGQATQLYSSSSGGGHYVYATSEL